MKIVSYILLFLVLYTPVSKKESTQQTSAEINFSFVSKDVQGTIEGFEFSGEINSIKLEASSFSGSVVVGTMKTGNFLRDWHLKGSKYFDEDQFPHIYFNSSKVEIQEDRFLVSGDLTIKDISKPLIWVFKKEGNLLKGSTTIYTSDFDIAIKKDRADNKVNITIEISI